jgi:hypothetical protein
MWKEATGDEVNTGIKEPKPHQQQSVSQVIIKMITFQTHKKT